MYRLGSTYSVTGTEGRTVGVVIPSFNTWFLGLCSVANRDTEPYKRLMHTYIGYNLQADALTVPIKGHFRVLLDC